MDYGKAATKACAHKKMLRKHMATSLGLSNNYFYTICTGERKPSLDVLENLAKVCNVPLSTLIKWGEE